MRKLEAITRDQEWLAAILEETRLTRTKLDRIIQLLEGNGTTPSNDGVGTPSAACPECGKTFSGPQAERALRAHAKVHARREVRE